MPNDVWLPPCHSMRGLPQWLPERAHLARRDDAIGGAAEDEEALGRHARRQRERRHDAEQARDARRTRCRSARRARGTNAGTWQSHEAHDVDHRHAGDHAGELGLERRRERGDAAAEREPVEADRHAVAGAQPREEPAQIPDRLRLQMHHVEDLAREEAVAAPPAARARPVQRQHRQHEVHAERLVQPARAELEEAGERRAGAIAVQADQPRTRRTRVLRAARRARCDWRACDASARRRARRDAARTRSRRSDADRCVRSSTRVASARGSSGGGAAK